MGGVGDGFMAGRGWCAGWFVVSILQVVFGKKLGNKMLREGVIWGGIVGGWGWYFTVSVEINYPYVYVFREPRKTVKNTPTYTTKSIFYGVLIFQAIHEII
jgi:hypothetical protein